jgi:ABC-type uncharacterized transport system involved in gliding motility auxiliary subunit
VSSSGRTGPADHLHFHEETDCKHPLLHGRIDLTSEKAYTLSAGTRSILAKLDTPVKIRFYCTRDAAMPTPLKLYAQEVEDLLNEYRRASNGKIQIQKLDPEPDSEAEDSARLDGVDGQPLTSGDSLYLGLSVSMLDQKEAIPFLSPDRERLLEYDISHAISQITSTHKPVVGIMSPLQLAGDPMAAAMGQQGQPPWVFYTELQGDYTVKLLEMNTTAIPADVDVLVLIHPRDITSAAEYAIDQFILRGGKMIAFVDPCAVLDNPSGGEMPQASSSNLPTLFKAWGINFDSTQILVDMKYLARTDRGPMPGLMDIDKENFSKDDLVTADVSDLLLAFPGVFQGTPVAGLKETVLVKSSTDTEFTNPISAEMSPEQTTSGFVSLNKEFPLAIRLTGKFKTAFPDGPPKDTAGKKDDAGTQGDAAKKDDKNATPAPQLKESNQENTVILVGDSDMLQDNFTVSEEQDALGRKVAIPSSGNLAFAENAVEQLTGDSNLIAIRSRPTRARPFTVVEKMEQSAEASQLTKEKGLESSLSDTEAKINEMQQHRSDSDQKNVLSPEQKAELEKLREKKVSVDKEIRQVHRDLNARTNSLENRVKWINIALMPSLVAAAGLALALIKRKRSAAI